MTAELAPIDPPDDSRYDEPDYGDEGVEPEEDNNFPVCAACMHGFCIDCIEQGCYCDCQIPD